MEQEEKTILENRLTSLEERLNGLSIPFKDAQLDPTSRILLRREILKPISGIVVGISAATATNYGAFFVSDRSYLVISISEEHRTAGSDPSAVTVTVEKAASGAVEDAAANSVLLTTAFSLKATAATPQFGTLTATNDALILRRGDRLILRDAGTLTAVAHVCVTVLLREL